MACGCWDAAYLLACCCLAVSTGPRGSHRHVPAHAFSLQVAMKKIEGKRKQEVRVLLLVHQPAYPFGCLL